MFERLLVQMMEKSSNTVTEKANETRRRRDEKKERLGSSLKSESGNWEMDVLQVRRNIYLAK